MTPRLLLIIALVTLHAAAARADGDATTDTVPRLIPYQGILQLDGRPFDATGEDALHLMFALYDGPDADAPLYRQPITVEVHGGRFTAAIGPTGLGADDAPIAIEAVIRFADALHLGITMLGDPDDPADDIELARRQPIYATAYALWTTSATNLDVAGGAEIGGDLIVGGTLRVDGDAVFPDSTVHGDAIADGSLRRAELHPTFNGEGVGDGDRAFAIDPDWLDDRIRSWVRAHCQIQLGWNDNCNNCGNPPEKEVTVRADGVCTGGRGRNAICRDQDRWGGVNTDGEVDGNDVFMIRLVCN